MQKLTIRYKVKGSDDVAIKTFDNHREYLGYFKKLRMQYDILEETTSTALLVSSKPTLFD